MNVIVDKLDENSNRFNLKLKKLKDKNKDLDKYLKYLNVEFYFTYNANLLIELVYNGIVTYNYPKFIDILNLIKNCFVSTVDILGNKVFNKKDLSIIDRFIDSINHLLSLNIMMIRYYISNQELLYINSCKLISDILISKINKLSIKKNIDDILLKDKYIDIRNQFYKERVKFEEVNLKITSINDEVKQLNLDNGDFWLKEINIKNTNKIK